MRFDSKPRCSGIALMFSVQMTFFLCWCLLIWDLDGVYCSFLWSIVTGVVMNCIFSIFQL